MIINEMEAAELANLFRAMSDPTCLRIISALLEQENNVKILAIFVGISESAMSHQLRTLRLMRLVKSYKQGREVFYCLDDDHVIDLFKRSLDHIQHG